MAFTFKHGDRPLEGYTIQRGIGRGGFGEVYYAISDGGREVALKYLRDNSEIELRGVSHCMNLKSSHLVTIFDVMKNADGEYFIVMEHVSGPSLQDLVIAEPKGMGIDKAAFFIREIGKGLAYLHDRGIVHRDMKPANVFYEEGHVKIGDYGLSKFISVSRHSAQTTSIGTVHYMAPEVGTGNYHRGIDIYALGVMLYEMLLGKVPFEGSSMGEILMKHLTEQPEVADLPEPFGKVIRKALEKDPKDRYQDVRDMVGDMLDVGTVRDSLAGFNPSTISAVPRRPLGMGVDSPVPSPNPVGPQHAAPPMGSPGGLDVGAVPPLPPRVARRQRHISERIERKMNKLAGRPRGHRRRHQPPHAAHTPGAAALPAQPTGGLKRFALPLVLTLVVSAGVGLLVSTAAEVTALREAVGTSTGMMIAAITLGLGLASKATHRIGSGADPGWVRKTVLVCCCAPFMAIASVPTIETYENGYALLIAMLLVLFTSDLNERQETGARGELSFGSAFSLAIWGGIACYIVAAIFGVGYRSGFDHEWTFAIMGASIGGALSLLTQASAWFLQQPGVALEGQGLAPQGAAQRTPMADAATPPHADPIPSPPPYVPETHDPLDRSDIAYAIPVEQGTPVYGMASTTPAPRPRSMFARGFYSVVTFLMLFGVVANIIYAALVGQDPMVHAVLASACASLMLFAAQKLTLRKRRGFWRETACPFLIAVVMTGLGTCIALLATQCLSDEALAFTIIGIAFSGLLLLILIAARFWPMLDQLDGFVKENLEGCCPAPNESDFDACAEPCQAQGDDAGPTQGEVRA